MNLKLVNRKLSIALAIFGSIFVGESMVLQASNIPILEDTAVLQDDVDYLRPIYEDSINNHSDIRISYEIRDPQELELETLNALAAQNDNIGFVEMAAYILVREEPNSESEWTGKLFPNNIIKALDLGLEWSYIQSGQVRGYVPTEYLVLGEEAKERQNEIEYEQLEVNVNTLNVRTGNSTEYETIGQIYLGDVYDVLDVSVEGWYPILYEDEVAYVCGEYVNITIKKSQGLTREEEERIKEEERLAEEYKNNIGAQIVDYALQFVGNPYVWGGTNLVTGADCSGFVQSIFKDFGISVPRTSYQQRSVGEAISYEEAQPGDIICYEGHVGIYIGNNEIVNARNSNKGIGVTSATYNTIVAVRRLV